MLNDKCVITLSAGVVMLVAIGCLTVFGCCWLEKVAGPTAVQVQK